MRLDRSLSLASSLTPPPPVLALRILGIAAVLTDMFLFWSDFTGISAPYEAPESPEIHIKTDEVDVTEAVRRITDYLAEKKFI